MSVFYIELILFDKRFTDFTRRVTEITVKSVTYAKRITRGVK